MKRLVFLFLILGLFMMPNLTMGSVVTFYGGLAGKEIEVKSFSSGESVLVAVDTKSYILLKKVINSRDNKTLIGLMFSDKVFDIWDGTRVLVVGVLSVENRARIHILEGKHAGKSGWVIMDSLRGIDTNCLFKEKKNYF